MTPPRVDRNKSIPQTLRSALTVSIALAFTKPKLNHQFTNLHTPNPTKLIAIPVIPACLDLIPNLLPLFSIAARCSCSWCWPE